MANPERLRSLFIVKLTLLEAIEVVNRIEPVPSEYKVLFTLAEAPVNPETLSKLLEYLLTEVLPAASVTTDPAQ